MSRSAPVRVLVVEDFLPFRRAILLILAEMSDLQVVGETAHGMEAVQKAVELKPDLILLDIGLPSLNGIEVARQIRRLVPESKIIFLTQETAVDVVQEAIGTGARGYVVKMKAGNDLLSALKAVLSGKTFISRLSPTDNFTFPD
jgi:DNA-binding NarL/FixJ family response regulator